MIEVFGSHTASSGNASGGNPAQLAPSIFMTLYNTAFGLMVDLPALIFWCCFCSHARAEPEISLIMKRCADRRKENAGPEHVASQA